MIAYCDELTELQESEKDYDEDEFYGFYHDAVEYQLANLIDGDLTWTN